MIVPLYTPEGILLEVITSISTAKLNGKQIGRIAGKNYITFAIQKIPRFFFKSVILYMNLYVRLKKMIAETGDCR